MAEVEKAETLAFKRNYDKELENELARRFFNLIEELNLEYAATGSPNIQSPELVSEVKGILQPVVRLFTKYKENKKALEIIEYGQFIRPLRILPSLATIEAMEMMSQDLAQIMGSEHGFMDNVRHVEPFEKTVKKKFRIPEVMEEKTEEYYQTIRKRWEKLIFLCSYYQVMRKGAIHCLVTGINDCLEENEWVYTPKGAFRAKEMYDGREILGGRIINTHSFEDDIYELEINGYKFKANGEHPIMVKKHHLKDVSANWMPVKEIYEKYSKFSKASRYWVEHSKASRFKVEEISIGKDFAKLLGYLMSDGSFSEKQSVKFTNISKVLITDFIQLASKFREEFNYEIKTYDKGKGKDILLVGKHGSSRSPLKDKLRALKILDRSTFGELQRLTEEELKEFISGFFNGDGSLTVSQKYDNTDLANPIIEFAMGIKETQAYEMQYMLWRLGIMSRVTSKKGKGATQSQWSIYVTNWINCKKLLKFLDTRKYPNKFLLAIDGINKIGGSKVNNQENEDSVFKPITSIKKIGRGKVIGWQTTPSHEIISKLGLRTHNSGKTHTAVPFCQKDNFYLRTFWKVHEDEAKTIPLHKFSLKKDVKYLPVAADSNEDLGDLYYQSTDMNEGMTWAIKNKSQNAEVIEAGINAYITRSHKDFKTYEYQLADRPTSLLMGRFNMWVHKVSPEWGVLSMPSSVYRKADPLYLKEIEKLRKDQEVVHWLVYENPNFVCWLHTPRLKDHIEKRFERYQAQAHKDLQTSKLVKAQINEKYYTYVQQIWERVNVKKDLIVTDVPSLLTGVNYTKSQIDLFMREYRKFDGFKKLDGNSDFLTTGLSTST